MQNERSALCDRLSWFALHVRTRRECAVDLALTKKGYETYLPMITETRVYDGKRRRFEVPGFPGYLFCRFHPGDALAVMKTPEVYTIVRRGRSAEPVPDSELNSLKVMIASGVPLERHIEELAAGDRVYINRGPLTGLTGVLLRVGKSQRVTVSIALLRRSLSAEVHCDDLFHIGPEAASVEPGIIRSADIEASASPRFFSTSS